MVNGDSLANFQPRPVNPPHRITDCKSCGNFTPLPTPWRVALRTALICYALLLTGGTGSQLGATESASTTDRINGALMVPVTLLVLDAQTAQPLARVAVTFFTAREVEVLDAIAAGRRPPPADKSELPPGVTVRSSKEGEVRLTCEFSATFVESMQNGEAKITQTTISPTGRFVVKKAGYHPIVVLARDLFASVHGSATEFGHTITLRLQKAPDKT